MITSGTPNATIPRTVGLNAVTTGVFGEIK
jgi:hypothetical protein